jgi:uncharacterized protein (TIGR00725 family)
VTGAPVVAVAGSGDAAPGAPVLAAAEEVGRLLGAAGCVVVTGGLGGVMAAASRGASGAGATVVGLLPGLDRSAANPWVGVAVPTGLGELRNGLVVRAADVLVAVGGGHGTLSEVALALKAGKRVVGLGFGYAVDGVEAAADPADAAARALARGV